MNKIRTTDQTIQEQDVKHPTPEHKPAFAEPEKNAKVNQALRTALTFADRIQRRPITTHLIRAAERFDDCMGSWFGVAITYFSFLLMIPILMVSFVVTGPILASYPTLS